MRLRSYNWSINTVWKPTEKPGSLANLKKRKIDDNELNQSLSRRDVRAKGGNPYAVGYRRQRAGGARARDRAVLRARLQYRLAHRVGDRAPKAPLAHHHCHARHADGDRADQEPARSSGAGASGG